MTFSFSWAAHHCASRSVSTRLASQLPSSRVRTTTARSSPLLVVEQPAHPVGVPLTARDLEKAILDHHRLESFVDRIAELGQRLGDAVP